MEEKSYTRIEDFLEDKSLISWLRQNDPEAAMFWQEWREKHPERVELLETAKQIIQGIQVNPKYVSDEKVALELDRLEKRILSQRKTQATPHMYSQPWYREKQKWAWAAAFLLLLLTGIFSYQSAKISYSTDYGERLVVSLVDGSLLILNANSHLYFTRATPRKIHLEGEAFFKVAKKYETAEKFQVITSDLKVEVYGTEFNVNSREEQTQVILTEGFVKLELKNGERQDMMPGDLLTYSATQNKIVDKAKPKDLDALTSWKDGSLIFEDISLQKAMEKIGELYGLKIAFENIEMAHEQIHLAVPTDNLEICIQALEQSANLQIDLIEDLLKISRPKN